MPRYIILLLGFALLLGDISFAQTAAQIDSTTAASRQLNAPDTVHFAYVRSYKPTALPTIFETAFFMLSSVVQDSIRYIFAGVDIGSLNCETGRLIACDPIVMQDIRPFVQQFPIGRFPVQLSIASFNGQERVAFSRICFSDHPVVRWEFALDSGQKQQPIFGDTFYSYSVDGGVAVFIDSLANQAFNELTKADIDLWGRVFSDELDKHNHLSWQYGLYAFQGHNLAAFTTGWGDGRYGTYVGYDKDGQICRLLTDFGLINWWKK